MDSEYEELRRRMMNDRGWEARYAHAAEKAWAQQALREPMYHAPMPYPTSDRIVEEATEERKPIAKPLNRKLLLLREVRTWK